MHRRRQSSQTTGESFISSMRAPCWLRDSNGAGLGAVPVLPNKRLKLAWPAFRGSEGLCTSQQVPQHGALALAPQLKRSPLGADNAPESTGQCATTLTCLP